eukprot:Phypoly_transcript_14502.p1 GENE.Phypoly_transcript_14502~~Phypoly_transcript_14502.p1  ORF type:complete len:265 (+),score=39.67 Phypoly_transcript_14502:110-904(+)
MATTTTTHIYVPQTSSSVYNESLTAPSGLAPRPLPTSHNYVRPVKQHKGLSATLKDAASRFTSKAQRSWNEATDERFRRYFGFSFTEQLFGEWWGDVWTGGQLIPACCYISTNYLCILYKKKDAVTKDKVHIKATIALRDITYLQRAVCLPAAAGGTPIIQPINDPSVKSDSIIVYTCDGKMHQFCRFFNYDTFVHTLDWNWRTIKSGQTPNTVPYSTGLTANPGQPAMQQQTNTTTGFMGTNTANPTLVKQTTTTTTALPHAP